MNVASGDLIVRDTDFSVTGTGPSYSSIRTWNDLNPEYGDYGGWWDSNDTGLSVWGDGSVTFSDPTGTWYTFRSQSNGSFITPAGISANMCAAGSPAPCPASLPSGVSYELIYDQTQTRLEFNSSGMILATIDRYGNQQTVTYGSPWIDHITDNQGRSFKYSWTTLPDGDYWIGGIQDAAGGRSVSFAYTYGGRTTDDRLSSSTDAAGHTTSYSYWPWGDLETITDPNGNETVFTFNGSHQITSMTRVTNTATGTGRETTYTYYGFGAATGVGCTVTQKATVVTDADGNAGASGHTTTYCSNTDDDVEQTINANGQTTAGAFNAQGDQTSLTQPGTGGSSADVSSVVYDATGQDLNCAVAGTSSPVTTCPTGASAGVTASSTYDGTFVYQPATVTDAQGNTDNNCYYGGSNACTGGGGSGFTGPVGELERETDPLSTQNSLNFSYNTNGTIAKSQNADGNTTTYGYDAYGNLTSLTPPTPLGAETFGYDTDSRQTSYKDSDGNTTISVYNAIDDDTSDTFNGTTLVSYTYDPDGNLLSETDPSGTETNTYNSLNQLTKTTLPGGQTISYTYDPVGNLASMTDASGTTSYTYNGLNQLTTLTEPGGYNTTFTYDRDGNRTGISYPNGVTVTYTYDAADRAVSMLAKSAAGTTLASETYSYMSGSADTALIQTATDQNGNVTTYTYDQLNRLVQAKTLSSSGVTVSNYQYSYDGDGNRLTQIANGTNTSYTYNAADELTAIGPSSLSYDADGNETNNGTIALTYNNRDQTTNIGTSTTGFFGTSQNTQTTSASATLINNQLGLDTITNGSNSDYITIDNQGNALGERTPASRFYYITDPRGTVLDITNSSGTIVRTNTYDPYGNISTTTGTGPNDLGYLGADNSQPDNLYHFGARFLDLSTGRWTQPDPDAQSLAQDPTQGDPYIYAGDDPINLSDASGDMPNRSISSGTVFRVVSHGRHGVTVGGVLEFLSGGTVFGAGSYTYFMCMDVEDPFIWAHCIIGPGAIAMTGIVAIGQSIWRAL